MEMKTFFPCLKLLLISIIIIEFKGGGGTWWIMKAEANLLQFPSKSTVRPRPVAVRTLLPFVPSKKKNKSSMTLDLEKFRFFVQFLTAYSTHKKWTSAQLLFPRPDNILCRHFQVSLLREASLSTTCQDSLSMTETDAKIQSSTKHSRQAAKSGNIIDLNNNTQKLVSSQLSDKVPIVACHFLTVFAANQSGTINVSPKFLINYSADVLVVVGNYESTEKIIDELQPEGNTNYKWTLASRLNQTNMNLEMVYGIATSSTPLRNPIGSWSQPFGLVIDYGNLGGPSDFQGKLLRVTTVEGQPFVYVHESGGTFEVSGYLHDILLAISSQLNFEFKIFPPADKSFGTADEHGNFSGMVGQLQRKEVDLALMSFSYTEARRAVMSFSPPVEFSATRLLIRKDRIDNEVNWLAYLDPFEWKVWVAIPVTICLGVFTFLAIARFKIMKTTPGQSAWLLSLCFLQQGQDEHTMVNTFPGRIVLGSFWILAVVLYSSYTAKITSSLATVSERLPLNSLAEAVGNSNWKIGVIKGSSTPERVKGSDMPEMKKMWHRIEKDSTSLLSGFQEGIEKVYNEKLVFFTSDLIPAFLVKDNCSYTWIPGKFFAGFGYMGYQKNLPYADSISDEVAKLRQSGQMKRLFRKWWGIENSCAKEAGNGIQRMSLYKTGTAFLVLISGTVLSFVFVLVEFCVHLKKPPDKINEEHLLPPQFSASTNSGNNSSKELIGGVREPFHIKNNTEYRPNIQQQSNGKGLFLHLTTPFHYLYPRRNSSMPKNWSIPDKATTKNPLTLNF